MDPRAHIPAILAPAGNQDAFLAAIAAGADEIYCGLKHHSARMAAVNFSLAELASLVELAHAEKRRVFVTLNTLLQPAELESLASTLDHLQNRIAVDGLIIQDPAMLALARQVGFRGEIHLSTLANAGFPSALDAIARHRELSRVVMPRELNIDELRQMVAACRAGIKLEIFVHGALCYAVSGRCYWSSYLGGKSGLRGRCVQPCRRQFQQDNRSDRFFSCQDLSLDVLTRVIKPIKEIAAWKIEGRKKTAHYVYYTVTAYRILRDEGDDPRRRRDALGLLSQALGRPAGHYRFLPQRTRSPIGDTDSTGSGMLIGRIKGGGRRPYLIAHEPLMRGDVIRVGTEDRPWHRIVRIRRPLPKGGRFDLPTKGPAPPKGTPLFLTDRREDALSQQIENLAARLRASRAGAKPAAVRLAYRAPIARRRPPFEMHIYRQPSARKPKTAIGYWLRASRPTNKRQTEKPQTAWHWLPPVVWPETENQITSCIRNLIKKGARRFVLNGLWQTGLFDKNRALTLWAGPFCNLANPLGFEIAADMGISGIIISPELGRADILALPGRSPLPLGVVVSGSWPLCISRILSQNLKPNRAFSSPKGEVAWVRRYDDNYWLYPNWQIDLSAHWQQLRQAGYQMAVHLHEPLPPKVSLKRRPGLWNWKIGLK